MGGRGSSSITEKSAIRTGTNLTRRERAEEIHKILRDAGMPPVKSIAETEQMLKSLDKRNGVRDSARQRADDLMKQMNKAGLPAKVTLDEAEKIVKKYDKKVGR